MSDKQASIATDRIPSRSEWKAHFAWLRTRLAAERTMMAYMRTAVSLIGFGFAIFQFFYRAQQAPEDCRCPLSGRSLVSGACADFLRHDGGAALAPAVPFDD